MKIIKYMHHDILITGTDYIIEFKKRRVIISLWKSPHFRFSIEII